MRIKRTLATVAAAALATTGLVACSNESEDTATTAAEGENTTIKIGTTEADQEAWRVFKDLAADNGIDLDIVQFSDYSPVNEALAQGELDVNKFQHIKYLAEYNKASNNDLRVVGSTEIVPWHCSGRTTTPSTASRAKKSPSRTTRPTRAAPSTCWSRLVCSP